MLKKYTPPKCPKPSWQKQDSLISHGTSKQEKEVLQVLRMEFPNIPIYGSDRAVLCGRELDIYIPSKNLAIEYNGLYFHNSSSKDMNYHINKTIMCNRKGIRLISLFSDEWEQKKGLCIDLIRKAMGSYIEVKNFYVRELELNEAIRFFNSTSLLGYDRDTSISVGCFAEDKLISAIGIKKENEVWTITRYAEMSGIRPKEGILRMVEFLEEEYSIEELMLILDRRLYEPGMFVQLGFELKEYTRPNISYTKDFKSRITEKDCKINEETLEENGYLKVFDCGYIKLIYNIL